MVLSPVSERAAPFALAPYVLYRGEELQSAATSLGALYAPSRNDLGVIRPIEDTTRAAQPSTIAGIRLSHLTIVNIQLGVRSQLTIGAQNAYHLAMPLRGEVGCFFASRKVLMAPGRLAVTAPSEPVLIPSWGDDAEVLCIQIHPGALEGELSRMLGRPAATPIVTSDLDLRSGPGASWFAALSLLVTEMANSEGLVARDPAYADDLQRLMITAFLRATTHQFSAELERHGAPPRWRSVKRAVDAVQAEPERDWTLADLARIGGVGTRRLQQGFNEQLDISPMAFVQAVRFDRVREDLVAGAERIGDTALRWGFTHLGRFSAGYRQRFGETPRETQRAARITAERLTARP